MAQKILIKNKHNYIQSYSFRKNQQRKKRCNNKSKYILISILEIVKDL